VQDALTVALPRFEAPWAYHGRVQIVADEVLAKRAADGDESAFEELVVRYQDRLYTLAVRITLSDADAYDCVQEGLVAAWRGLGSFRFDARFSTWIHRIVGRKAPSPPSNSGASSATTTSSAATSEPPSAPLSRTKPPAPSLIPTLNLNPNLTLVCPAPRPSKSRIKSRSKSKTMPGPRASCLRGERFRLPTIPHP